MNLSRNMGGDIGIAFVTTLIARRAQLHQANLSSHTTTYNPAFTARLRAIAAGLEHSGASSVDAMKRATAIMYRQLQAQATQLAYLDVLKILGYAVGLMIPLLLLTRKVSAKGAPAAH